MVAVAPSILSADFLTLGLEILALEQAGADRIHIDVMDGHFVPNLTMGPLIISAVKQVATVPLDVHLMIENPECYIDAYIDSGADFLTIHAESLVHLERAIKQIKSRQVKAGVALNPSTHENALAYVVAELDLVLVMSVNPGFGNQQFLPSALKKIAAVKSMIEQAGNHNCIISVDGGITAQTAGPCIKAGASCLVAGSFIFKSADYKTAIDQLRECSL